MLTYNINTPRWFDLEDLPGEQWRDMEEFSYFYAISNYGRVKSYKRDKPIILSTITNVYGYNIVKIAYGHTQSKNNPKRSIQVHRLVAQYFVENSDPEHKIIVNHKDGNKMNNYYTNLEWCSYLENTQHAIATGLFDPHKPKNKKNI